MSAAASSSSSSAVTRDSKKRARVAKEPKAPVLTDAVVKDAFFPHTKDFEAEMKRNDSCPWLAGTMRDRHAEWLAFPDKHAIGGAILMVAFDNCFTQSQTRASELCNGYRIESESDTVARLARFRGSSDYTDALQIDKFMRGCNDPILNTEARKTAFIRLWNRKRAAGLGVAANADDAWSVDPSTPPCVFTLDELVSLASRLKSERIGANHFIARAALSVIISQFAGVRTLKKFMCFLYQSDMFMAKWKFIDVWTAAAAEIMRDD